MFACTLSILLFVLATAGPAVQCQQTSGTTATTPSISVVKSELNQPRPSLRELFFSGLFLLRPSVMDTPIETLDGVKAVPEMDNNELLPLGDRSTGIIEFPSSQIAAEKMAAAATLPPSSLLSPSLYARFSALSDRFSTEKAILPPAMPVLHQVSSDQVVKKINYISPRMYDTIPQLMMTDWVASFTYFCHPVQYFFYLQL